MGLLEDGIGNGSVIDISPYFALLAEYLVSITRDLEAGLYTVQNGKIYSVRELINQKMYASKVGSQRGKL